MIGQVTPSCFFHFPGVFAGERAGEVAAVVAHLAIAGIFLIFFLVSIDTEDEILAPLCLWWDRGGGIIFLFPTIVLVILVAVRHLESRIPDLALRP